MRLEPFVGIGPRRFLDYFSMSLGSGYLIERKTRSGDIATWDPTTIGPRTQGVRAGILEDRRAARTGTWEVSRVTPSTFASP